MPTFKVNVKWGKEKFSNVECNTEEPPMLFKAQLFALSGVQPERQKVMMKGAVLKDEEWGNVKLKNGATLLMMGSADELPPVPVEKPVFMEDMSDAQLATALDMPPGLTNLGNTCYMNATVQCLKVVPELVEALKKFDGNLTLGGSLVPADSITADVMIRLQSKGTEATLRYFSSLTQSSGTEAEGLRDLYISMEKTSTSIPPIIMLQILHMAFPQFAEKSEHGGFAQQDANELWTQLVRCLQQKLKGIESSEGADSSSGGAAAAAAMKGFIDQYFGIHYDTSMKCVEAETEAESKSTETVYQLSCFIGQDVKYLHTGLKNRLMENITKHSPTLSRDAEYIKTSKIGRLPGYVTIQFVRFFYKEKESINAKILKDVKFPMVLDVFELCSEGLQEKLLPMREKFKAVEDEKVEKAQKAKDAGVKEVVKKNTKVEPYSFPDDIGSNNSGFYTLQAVLTHKGRSSSSGHYVAWVRRKDDEWTMFDDDKVSPVTSEDVLKLSGGGDWHSAYVLLYAPRILEVDVEEDEEKMET